MDWPWIVVVEAGAQGDLAAMVSSYCEEPLTSLGWDGVVSAWQGTAREQGTIPAPTAPYQLPWVAVGSGCDQSPWARSIQWQRDVVVPRKGRAPGIDLSLERTKAESSCSVGASERLSHCTG